MKALQGLLQNIFEKNEWQYKLLKEWNNIVGSLYTKVRIEKIQGATLVLGVYEASWLQELYILSPVLIKSINQSLSAPHIKQIRFKHVAYTQTQKSKKSIPQKKEQPDRLITLSPQEQLALNRIKDNELQIALHRFFSKCKWHKGSYKQ